MTAVPLNNRSKDGSPATFALMAALAIAHGVQLLLIRRGEISPSRLLELFGASSAGIAEGNVWQPLSSLFTHTTPVALLWDLMVLFVAGRLFEQVMGPRPLLRAWLACGVLGGLGAAMFPGPPLAGAGAANVGVLLCLAVSAPRRPVPALLITLKTQWVVAVLVVFEVLLLGLESETARVAPAWALFCGAFAGFLGSILWPHVLRPPLERLKRRRQFRREVEALERGLMEEPELDRILDKIASEGIQSLTLGERRFLRRASSRYHSTPRS